MATPIQLIQQANKQIATDIKKELAAQGHRLTGYLEQSVKEFTFIKGGVVILEGYANFYIEYTENGVPSERIPYNPDTPGRAKTSKYIQALIGYFIKRGLSAKEAKGAAFATARKHSQKGMPTAGSYRFSKTGERLGAIKIVFERNQARYSAIMENAITKSIESVFLQAKTV